MKGNENLLVVLNQLLADEVTAISQYMVHSEMCESWGFGKLHKAIEGQAMDEMHHAEWLIQRILFLDGVPIVSKLNPINIGATVVEIITGDQEAELSAVRAYNDAIGFLIHNSNVVIFMRLLLRRPEPPVTLCVGHCEREG